MLPRHLLPLRGFLKKDAPDNAGLNAAALQSAALSRESLDWFKSTYDKEAPLREQAAATNQQVAQAQLGGMNFATQQAQEAAARNKSVFQPLENQLVSMASGYDTPGRRAQAVGEATADVEQGFGSAQAGLNRSLARMGVAPGSGRSQALMQDAALQKGSAIAGATHNAVQGVEQQGWSRMADVANLGRNLPSMQATQQQIATSTGNAAVGANNAALGAATSGTGLMQQGFNTALAGQGQAGSLYGQAGALQNQARGQDMNFIGGLMGDTTKILLGMSDRTKKKGTGKPADGDKALAEVNATKVEDDWQYDPKKGGPDDGGRKHTGPMAQSVKATMGESVAPGGKAIDLVSMNGKLMASMQALTKRVERVEKQKEAA